MWACVCVCECVYTKKRWGTMKKNHSTNMRCAACWIGNRHIKVRGLKRFFERLLLISFYFILFSVSFFIYCNSAIFLGTEHTHSHAFYEFSEGFSLLLLLLFHLSIYRLEFYSISSAKRMLELLFYCKRRGEADTVCSFNSIICWSNYEFNMYGGAVVVYAQPFYTVHWTV